MLLTQVDNLHSFCPWKNTFQFLLFLYFFKRIFFALLEDHNPNRINNDNSGKSFTKYIILRYFRFKNIYPIANTHLYKISHPLKM